MRRHALSLFLLLPTGLTGAADVQGGKVIYEQHCGACHGNDGSGAQDGQGPPLAESAWVKGAPDRMIQVVLHGLMGKITVPTGKDAGRIYDLVMPPQGAVLSDEKIAMILTYVRSSWGNGEGAVTASMVREQRNATGDRNRFWQVEEILDRHPLATGASLRIPESVPADERFEGRSPQPRAPAGVAPIRPAAGP